jgi:hypothetical protein
MGANRDEQRRTEESEYRDEQRRVSTEENRGE